MADRKATTADVEGAYKTLYALLPSQDLALEWWGQKVRVIRRDYSRPFGSNYMTKAQAYETIWFAINALRLLALAGGR